MRIQASQGSLARVGALGARPPAMVIAGWLAAVLGAMAPAPSAGTRQGNPALPGTESQRATDLLQRQFPSQAGDAHQIALHREDRNDR